MDSPGIFLFEWIVRAIAIGLSWAVLTPVFLVGAIFSREPYWGLVIFQYRRVVSFWTRL